MHEPIRWTVIGAIAVSLSGLVLRGADARAQVPEAPGATAPAEASTWRPRTLTVNAKIRGIVASVAAERLGATVAELARFGSRNTFCEPASAEKGIGGARAWLLDRLRSVSAEAGGRLQVSEDIFRTAIPPEVAERMQIADVDAANLVAILPGGSPASRGRFLVVAANYDSRNEERFDVKNPAPGADANASGVAVALELATVLAPHGFDATVVFVFFCGSEQGNLGSAHFAANARKDNLRIEAVLVNDSVGNVVGGTGATDGTRVRVFSPGPEDSPSRELARYVKERGEAYVPSFEVELVFREDRVHRTGDQLPFQKEGFAAVRLTERYENFERKSSPDDLPEHVHLPYLTSVARVNAAALASLASAPPPPLDVRRNWEASHYDTRIVWEIPKGSLDLEGHTILVRKTTSPVWQWEIPMTRTSDVVLRGISMDDFAFAVVTVDREGNESLPTPLR